MYVEICTLLRREMSGNVTEHLVERIIVLMSLTPHPFAKVAIEHGTMCSMLPFVPHLCIFPRVFGIWRMSSSVWIHKVVRMFYRQMRKSHGCYPSICSPHIGHNGSPRSNWCLNDSRQL